MKIPNQTIFTADNLDILRGMDSESVNLIYLDPPFNSNRHYEAPIGSAAAGAEFKDAWTFEDTKHAWWGLIADKHPGLYKVIDAAGDIGNEGDKAYLIYMATRLLEMHRILKPTGSIYLHCDPTMSHSLKMVMDAIFGRKNFKNEVVWCYKGMPANAKKWQAKHDVILFYVKGKGTPFHVLRGEPTEESLRTFKSGLAKGYNANNAKKMVTVFDWERYELAVNAGKIPKDLKPVEFTGGRPPLADWWADVKILGGPKNKERTGYPTQKPLALLRRIIEASSNKGDMVLDPFCGCATACLAAESLQRQWIGVDISPLAADLIRIRAEKELTDLLGSQKGIFKINHRTDIPIRSEHLKPPSKDINHTLFGQQEGKCNGCGHSFPFQNFTRDHIIPKARGGSDTDENLQLLCGRCNSIKGDRIMEYLIAKLIDEGIIEKPVKRR